MVVGDFNFDDVRVHVNSTDVKRCNLSRFTSVHRELGHGVDGDALRLKTRSVCLDLTTTVSITVRVSIRQYGILRLQSLIAYC